MCLLVRVDRGTCRTGLSRSIHDVRSITVGTISGNGTFFARSRSSASDASAPGATFGSCRCGVWSTGASASVPWKVWPTTTVSIAPFESAAIGGEICTTSPAPNRFATLRAASSEPGCVGSK